MAISKLLAILVLSGSAALLPSQTTLQRRAVPSIPAYVLGPGDQINLHVTDMEDLPDRPLRIDPSGFIDLPLAGRIEAAGLTLDQFKAELSGKLSKYITSPEISINLADSGSQPVSVIGEVNLPGVQQLSGSRRLIEVISLSGGLKPDAGPSVLVTRDPRWGRIDTPGSVMQADGYSTVTLSLDDLMTAKNPEDNLILRPNDVVSIPRAELIYVLGDVHKPGGFPLSTHANMSLLHVLSLAEGLGPDNSAKHARILRQAPDGDGTPREIPVDIDKIVAGQAPDFPLMANDVLFVPLSGVKLVSRRALEAAVGITSGLLIYR